MASSKIFLLVALLSACSAFCYGHVWCIALEHGSSAQFDERSISLEPEVIIKPTIYIAHGLPDSEQEVIVLPSEEQLNRMKRQNDGRQPMPSEQRGQLEAYGVHRTMGGKSLGTDFTAQATGRLWESRDGRSTLDANANYQRHFGGPSGTGRPSYGAGLNFNHRF